MEGGETVIRKYCVRKKSIFNKGKNMQERKLLPKALGNYGKQAFAFGCVSVVCKCVCVHACKVPTEGRRGDQISWSWSFRWGCEALSVGTGPEL